MKNRYILVVVFAVVCTVWSEDESQDCDTEELERCLSGFQAIAEIIGDDFTYTKETLDHVCPDVIGAYRCFESYAARCITEKGRNMLLRLLQQKIENLKKMCVPGPYQEQFLAYAPCMKEAKDDIVYCVQNFIQREEEFRPKRKQHGFIKTDEKSPESDSKIPTQCCLLRDLTSCYSRRVMVKCGEQAAKFIEDNIMQMVSILMPEGCDSSEQCEGSSARGNSPRALLLPVSLAMILPYALRRT